MFWREFLKKEAEISENTTSANDCGLDIEFDIKGNGYEEDVMEFEGKSANVEKKPKAKAEGEGEGEAKGKGEGEKKEKEEEKEQEEEINIDDI